MPDAVIVAAHRTPIGTAFKGTLRATEPADLAVPVLQAVLRSAGIARDLVDDVVLAESLHGGGVIARYAALEAGMTQVPGLAVNRHCAGGLSGIITAAAGLHLGDRAVVAGGVQSSSTAPVPMNRAHPDRPWLFESHRPTPDAPADDMSITVGWNAARTQGISREEQDAWALRSHRRAVAAIADGQFDDELVALHLKGEDGSVTDFSVDEHPRASTSADKLASLRVLHPEIEGFSITAGNASGINDAAAAVLVARSDVAAAHGLPVLARIVTGASVGVDPAQTGTAVPAAVLKALDRVGLTPADIDLWEINEAFASVPIAACRTLGLDESIVNPFGSGCSLGHPVAATGARMVTTLAHELRRRGGGTAVAAMCAGGGMASAVVLTAA
ncbi:thiolase family protein [Streptomyces sp. GQFP]|uniref:thiolase family protein n=1 Tax=Streptomyces sp. GQFP TaxID=2907545 RepID=UPI001F1A1EEA|nr:thiolase family protein [Streptomyces sp. GQFP]UIX31957.1 thiolase family protein [Streptomyces sp. GQFP]